MLVPAFYCALFLCYRYILQLWLVRGLPPWEPTRGDQTEEVGCGFETHSLARIQFVSCVHSSPVFLHRVLKLMVENWSFVTKKIWHLNTSGTEQKSNNNNNNSYKTGRRVGYKKTGHWLMWVASQAEHHWGWATMPVVLPPECGPKCRSKRHNQEVNAVITKGSLLDLQAYSRLCHTWPQHTDTAGRSALHVAASCGKLDILEWLLTEKQLDPSQKDKESGWTALHRALFYGQLAAARLLIQVSVVSTVRWFCPWLDDSVHG